LRPRSFAEVTGHVRRAHHARDGGRLRSDLDDADAHADGEHAVLPDEPIVANRLAQLFGQTQRLIERAARQQDPELIAAQPGERVGAAHARLQEARDLPKQLIARRMAAGIVDQLELVQIQIQKRLMRARILAHTLHRRRQSILEFAPVDEPGERIVARLIMQGAVQPPLLAHVVEHHDRADQVPGAVADGCSGVLNRDLLPAPGNEHRMLRESEHLALAQAPHDGALARLACALIDDGQHIGDQFPLRLAVLQPVRLPPPDSCSRFALRSRGDHRIADRLQRHLCAFLRLEHGSLGLLALGDIGDRALVTQDAAMLVAHDPSIVHHHDHAAVFASQHEFFVAHLSLGRHCAARTSRDRWDTSKARRRGSGRFPPPRKIPNICTNAGLATSTLPSRLVR